MFFSSWIKRFVNLCKNYAHLCQNSVNYLDQIMDHRVNLQIFIKICIDVLLTKAILQYYLHQLHELIHYPALRDVFHCFRELGNAILLFLMIEQNLVSQFEI